jgi:hypothetical protein
MRICNYYFFFGGSSSQKYMVDEEVGKKFVPTTTKWSERSRGSFSAANSSKRLAFAFVVVRLPMNGKTTLGVWL